MCYWTGNLFSVKYVRIWLNGVGLQGNECKHLSSSHPLLPAALPTPHSNKQNIYRIVKFCSFYFFIHPFSKRHYYVSFSIAQMEKNLPAMQRPWFDPWIGKILWRREWLPTPIFLPGQSHGQRSLVGYSPWGREESDMTEQHTHSVLGTPHQKSCSGQVTRGQERKKDCGTPALTTSIPNKYMA